MLVLDGIDDVKAHVGRHLGYSEWVEITQQRIDAFADATDDHQWIHVDPQRAADGPFGTTIAHGLLTLSLGPGLSHQVYRIEGITMGINYGYDRVRFPAPVPVGSRLRAGVELEHCEDVAGGVQIRLAVTFEVEGGGKPVCVAQQVLRYLV